MNHMDKQIIYREDSTLSTQNVQRVTSTAEKKRTFNVSLVAELSLLFGFVQVLYPADTDMQEMYWGAEGRKRSRQGELASRTQSRSESFEEVAEGRRCG